MACTSQRPEDHDQEATAPGAKPGNQVSSAFRHTSIGLILSLFGDRQTNGRRWDQVFSRTDVCQSESPQLHHAQLNLSTEDQMCTANCPLRSRCIPCHLLRTPWAKRKPLHPSGSA